MDVTSNLSIARVSAADTNAYHAQAYVLYSRAATVERALAVEVKR